ncbi:MAG TPA: hypothetical protein VFD94_09325, partial [Jatrophihabitans sp.]|nr:hypothetical protein [Jatrophihabitans sp.]
MSPLPSRLAALARRPSAEQLLVAVIVMASGLASAWNIGYAGYSTFYSTATHSMAVSWRALAFGAFDPGASITLDKLTGFLVPQALSARLFGFHPWSIALPQVLEGMVTVTSAAVIVMASGLASAWNIGYAGYSTFYSTATHSMAVSWRALA